MHNARVVVESDIHDSLDAVIEAVSAMAQAQAMSNQVQMQSIQMVAELVQRIAAAKKTVRKTKAIRDDKDRLIGAETTEEEE